MVRGSFSTRGKTIAGEPVDAQRVEALALYRAGQVEEAESLLKNAEQQERRDAKFTALEEALEPGWEEVMAVVDAFTRRVHGLCADALVTPDYRWALLEIIPPYYQTLRALGAQMLSHGRVAWPEGLPESGLPETPHWLPADPWDTAVSDEDWNTACGRAIQALGGATFPAPGQVRR